MIQVCLEAVVLLLVLKGKSEDHALKEQ